MIVQEIRNDNVFGYVRYQGEPNRKDAVIEKLRKQGFRITKQRCILLDIILDDSIGIATVYRMVNTLEDIGVISRKNMYKVACF